MNNQEIIELENRSVIIRVKKSDIPDWAKYLAMDADGDLCAFENEPKPCFNSQSWRNQTFTRFKKIETEKLYQWSECKWII